MRIGLVILNRNEREGLSALLPRLPRESVDLIFAVDGASTDGSAEILAKHEIEVLPQTSLGRGEAFRLAFAHARGKADALIFFGPDGNEQPEDIEKFRAPLEAGAEMVIASRMMKGAVNEEDAHWFRPRKWANLWFGALATWTWGRGQRKISDTINGFRAITIDAWDRLAPDGPGFTIEYQTSIRAYKHSLRVSEFPTTECPRIGGKSDARSIPTGLRFVKLYASELWRSLRPKSR